MGSSAPAALENTNEENKGQAQARQGDGNAETTGINEKEKKKSVDGSKEKGGEMDGRM